MENVTKAMIMSAGLGTRLEPLTCQVPKPLVPVANRPIMDILFESLSNIGIKDVICNTYYLSEQIINRYNSNNLGVNFNYIVEKDLSGTAGGLKKCQFFFDKGEDLVVMSADGLTNADIKRGIEAHKKMGTIATIGVKPIPKEEVSHFGVVVCDNQNYITEFQEKPAVSEAKSNLINTGIYIFNYKIFDYIPENTFYDFAKDVFPKLLLEREIGTFEVKEYWSDIGTLGQYMTSNQDVFSDKCQFAHDSITKTETGAYISQSYVEHVKFIGNSVVGSNCEIGNNVTLENCILWNDVVISDGVTLKNCIVSSGERISESAEDKVFGISRKELSLVD